MIEIKELNLFGNSGVLAYDTPFIDVSKFNYFSLFIVNNSNFSYLLQWSADGINTDYNDSTGTSAGNTLTKTKRVRAKYLRITYTAASTPTNWRAQLLFHDASEGLHNLQNSGATGAEIYKLDEREIRSIVSSDSSITVTQNTDDIDITTLSHTGATGPQGIQGIQGVTGPTGGGGGGGDYGFLYLDSNGWTGRLYNFTTSLTEVLPTSATYSTGALSNFTNPSNSRLQYTGSTTKYFNVFATIMLTTFRQFELAFSKNGTVETASSIYVNGPISITFKYIIQLAQNDYVNIWGRCDTAATRAITGMTLLVHSLT